ncbi:hypothetical protein ACFFUS_10520 [Vibrio gallaecicus]|uniref:hypothetical protein n=1 Tax=Vibrio gallaecicus TaxID=552386 RepID=UPI0010C95137|nr:hypothetical protein [Vibrio gallaecicus]MDN3616766.1 hypothetical protein [Vibrio gallaecicus]
METQLISVNDLGYMRHNRAYANRYRHTRRNQGVDTVAREFHKQLMLVERDITQWFTRLINSKNERILRYKSSNGMLKYQEIDFIAENEFGLKFCELKLNGSLAICIDMTFLYTGLESEGRNFTDVAVLSDYFQQKGENNHIWLDIKDVLSVALQEGWFTSERVEEIRELHEVMNNPMEMLPEVHEIPLNNPFAQLQATRLEC